MLLFDMIPSVSDSRVLATYPTLLLSQERLRHRLSLSGLKGSVHSGSRAVLLHKQFEVIGLSGTLFLHWETQRQADRRQV